MINHYGTVGAKVRGLAAERRMSQQHLADALGTSRHLVGKCLNGRRDFKVRELETLSELFGVPVTEFFEVRA